MDSNEHRRGLRALAEGLAAFRRDAQAFRARWAGVDPELWRVSEDFQAQYEELRTRFIDLGWQFQLLQQEERSSGATDCPDATDSDPEPAIVA